MPMQLATDESLHISLYTSNTVRRALALQIFVLHQHSTRTVTKERKVKHLRKSFRLVAHLEGSVSQR